MSDPHDAQTPGPDIAPLAGYTVVVASDQRRHPVAGLLESVGARAVGIQAARSVATPDEPVLREATTRLLAGGCDDLVVSSAVGLRAWVATARRWHMAQPLIAHFGAARLLARDAAAADSLRALGLTGIFSTDGQTTEELLRFLAAQPLAGRRIVVETHRMSLTESCAVLRAGGAGVIEAPTYTAAPPAESYSPRRLCDLVIRRQVDALVLVGAPVAEQVVAHAEREGRLDSLATALNCDVLCVALGSQTAHPLAARGVQVRLAAGPYQEEVAEEVLRTLPLRGLQVAAGGHQLEVRGQAVVLDGQFIAVPGGPLAVLRALARQPGQVLSAAEIRGGEPAWADVDDHAVEMAVSRLRNLLRGTDLVQTIVRRGYRLIT